MRSRSSTNETVTTMELAQEYLQHAEQCEQQAADAQLESSRVVLLTAAVIWRKLAVSPRLAGEARPTAAPAAE
jgi:hypothetical protein